MLVSFATKFIPLPKGVDVICACAVKTSSVKANSIDFFMLLILI